MKLNPGSEPPPARARTVPEIAALNTKMVQLGYQLGFVMHLHPTGVQDEFFDAQRPEIPDGVPIIAGIAYGEAAPANAVHTHAWLRACAISQVH